ncbi:MarR family transcriptional regulator [Paenibacillus glacialis]|uniref:HTH marR-type domain-containing protein n=1 Tax=Paenibacillus glacialis TaxID=494026 RepID=A0A168DFH1_9BACL|nr:MarR family transcriptional regulator [Paenibacillus glacialis]OAB34149.1 hypothetical protein PGLA_24960 [Paenibacillus glacialis]
MPKDSYPFPIYSGLLEPEHYNKISTAIWLFLWCISSVTKDKEDEEGVSWGIVLGNKPIKLDDLSEQFGVARKTISRWIDTLEDHGYIRVTRAPYGLIFTVRNSKKYRNKMDKNVHSEEREETDMSTLEGREETKMSTLLDKNVHSNKDIIKILIDRLIDGLDDHRFTNERCGVLTTVLASMPLNEIHLDEKSVSKRFSEIDRYYLNRKGKLSSSTADYKPMMLLAKIAIPIEFIFFGIDLSFARHDKQKRWESAEINLFSYCQKVIDGIWNQLLNDIKIANSESSGSVKKYPERKQSKTKQQRDLDELERMREEIRREQIAGH